jgi:hypothetical protein
MYQELAVGQLHHHHQKTKMALLVKLVKYYPIVMNLFIIFIMIGYYNGIKQPILYPFIGQSFYTNTLILILSHKLHFCLWNRILIYSMSFVLFLETIYNYGVNVNYYLYICTIISISALITATLLYYKNGCYTNRACKNIKENSKLD